MRPEKNPGEKSLVKSIVFYTYCSMVLVFMIMPNFVVFPISFSSATYLEFPPKQWSLRWYNDYFSREEWVTATIRSFEVGICVTIIAVALGSTACQELSSSGSTGSRMLVYMSLLPSRRPRPVRSSSCCRCRGSRCGFSLPAPSFSWVWRSGA